MSGLFDSLLASNGYKAFLFFDFSRQVIQVLNALLSRSAEACLRKEESKGLRAHFEQYLESIK